MDAPCTRRGFPFVAHHHDHTPPLHRHAPDRRRSRRGPCRVRTTGRARRLVTCRDTVTRSVGVRVGIGFGFGIAFVVGFARCKRIAVDALSAVGGTGSTRVRAHRRLPRPRVARHHVPVRSELRAADRLRPGTREQRPDRDRQRRDRLQLGTADQWRDDRDRCCPAVYRYPRRAPGISRSCSRLEHPLLVNQRQRYGAIVQRAVLGLGYVDVLPQREGCPTADRFRDGRARLSANTGPC